MLVVFLALFHLIYESAAQPELVYLLRTGANNTVKDVVSSPPARGYMTKIYDLAPHEASFPRLHPSTAFEANSNTFILGNVEPPLVGILDAFSRSFKASELPVYGSLLSFTAYDGQLYILQGLDEDVPFLGHVLSVDLVTAQIKHLFKFKLPAGTSFTVGAPLVFIPQEQAWLTPLGPELYKLNRMGAATATGIKGTWTHLYGTDEAEKFIGYNAGRFSWVNLADKSAKPLKQFGCAGVPAVNTAVKKIYHLQNCTTLAMYTVDFANTTESSVDLDPRLASAASAQSTGLYTPFGCGSACSVHTDCTNSTSCTTCRLGKCVSTGECGALCTVAADCFAGVCVNDCEDGRCGRIGCGNECKNHDDCKSHSTTCQICRLGKCVADGECGSYCLTSLDCYGGACVNNCVNWRCTENHQ